MNRKWLALALLMITAVESALADYARDLQFTNLSLSPNLTLAGLGGEQLNAVVYDGSSNFVAVGTHQFFVRGKFSPAQPWFTDANWVTNKVTTVGSLSGSNLTAVAASGSFFVASGDNNRVYTSVNGLNWNTNNNKIFNNNALVGGVAYNGNNFVAVGEAPEIGFNTNLAAQLTTPWVSSSFVNLSFAESYRGITAYRTNGFAVCGIFGLVRLSADAGKSWQQPIAGAIGQPDFYGIATDGADTFVCVGATNATASASSGINGVILSSTKHGTNGTWVAKNNTAPNSAINSVAYTGSGFVAVGNKGQILTSSNGVAWDVVPPANIPFAHVTQATNLNLISVVFAPNDLSNYLHDVGVIVGASGNVIVTAPPPPTNNSLGNKWICVGVVSPVWVGTNTLLPANTLQVTNAWGPDVVDVDWYDYTRTNPANGTKFTTNGMFSFTPYFNTTNTDNDHNVTNIYYAQARDLRTGFVNTNLTEMVLTNFMRPTATMITSNVICNGESTTLTNLLTGNAPWQVQITEVWANGSKFSYTIPYPVGGSGVYNREHPFTNTLTIPVGGIFNPTNEFLNQATNHYYAVTKLSDAFFPADDPAYLNPAGTNWAGDFVGTNSVTVYPRPTAVVSGTTNICNGQSATVRAALTGTGPTWTVTWQETWAGGSTTVTTNYTSSTATLTVWPTNTLLNASTNYTFTIIGLTDSSPSGCGAYTNDLSGSAVVTAYPRPTAVVSGTTNICNGQSATVRAALTGTGPTWTVTWQETWAGGSTTVTTNYTSSTATLTVWPTNTLLNASTNYTFTIIGLTDSSPSGCGAYTNDLSGSAVVTAYPRPTAVVSGTTNICNGQSATVRAALTGTGPTWTVTWQETWAGGSTTVTTNYTSSTATLTVWPTNTLLNASTNYAFTIIGLTDSSPSGCGAYTNDLSGSAVVTAYPRPTAVVSGTTNICNGQSATVRAALTGTGPTWTVTWQETWAGGSTTVTTNYTSSTATLTVWPTNTLLNASTNYTFTIIGLTDSSPSGCGAYTNDLSGSAVVTAYPRPTAVVSGTTNICNGQSATVRAALTGTGPTWTVTWQETWAGGSTTVTTNYTSSTATLTVWPTNTLLNASTNYAFTIIGLTDSSPSGCGAQTNDLSGSAVVTVYPRPTADLLPYNLTTCNNGQSPILTNILSGFGPWIIRWNDGSSQTATNIGAGPVYLSRTVYPTNTFGANSPSNNVYYVTNVVDVNSCVGNRPGDLTGTNILTINPRPTATLGMTNPICNGGLALLRVKLTGIGPWTVSWTDGVTNYNQSVLVYTNGPYTNYLTIPTGTGVFNPTNTFLNQSTNYSYWVNSVADSNCVADAGDLKCTNVVTVNPLPSATIIQVSNSYYNLLTFDDLPDFPIGIALTNGYAGLAWENFFVVDGTSFYTNGGGYLSGIVSSNNVIYSSGATASISNAAPFTLVSAYLTAASTNGLLVTALGFTNGSLAFSNVYTLTTNAPLLVIFNYTNVNRVVFSAGDGLPGSEFVLDNLTLVQTGPTEVICNRDSAVLQTKLTGIGPWTVTWTDGFTNYVQTVNVTNGPYTNSLTIPTGNGVFNPTNVFLNQSTNYYYWVSSVSNADTCSALVGALNGVASVTVNPRPTANVFGDTNVTVTNSSPVTAVIYANLSGFGPWHLTWSDGITQICTNSPAVRTVTNNLSLSGVSNISYIAYQRFRSSGTSIATTPLDSTNGSRLPFPDSGSPWKTNDTTFYGYLVSAPNVNTNIHAGEYQWYPTNHYSSISTNQRYWNYFSKYTNYVTSATLVSKTFAYAVTNLTDANSQCPAGTNDIFGSADILLSTKSTVAVYTTLESTNICLNTNPVPVFASFSGTPPWKIRWSDGTTNTVFATNNPFSKSVTPTNTGGWFNYTITNLIDGASVTSTNITGGISIYINSLPTGAPKSNGNKTNCAGVVNSTLSVTDTNNVIWFDAFGNVVASNTVSFIPADAEAGSYTYYAAEVNGSGCAGPAVAVNLVLLPTPANAPQSLGDKLNCVGNSNPALVVVDTNVVVWTDTNGIVVASNTVSFTPTNTAQGTWDYYAAEVNGSGCVGPTVRVSLVLVPVPTNQPVSLGNQTNCAGMPNPSLVVADTNMIIWTDTNGVVVASNTVSFTPTNTAPGTWHYFAAETIGSGCTGPTVPVNLVLLACTNPPVISLVGSNGTIQWFGNLTLKSATNLLPTATWTPVFTNPVVGPTSWSWTNGVPPWTNSYYFFRLFTN